MLPKSTKNNWNKKIYKFKDWKDKSNFSTKTLGNYK